MKTIIAAVEHIDKLTQNDENKVTRELNDEMKRAFEAFLALDPPEHEFTAQVRELLNQRMFEAGALNDFAHLFINCLTYPRLFEHYRADKPLYNMIELDDVTTCAHELDTAWLDANEDPTFIECRGKRYRVLGCTIDEQGYSKLVVAS